MNNHVLEKNKFSGQHHRLSTYDQKNIPKHWPTIMACTSMFVHMVFHLHGCTAVENFTQV